jgi:hypothetical protein
MKKLARMVHHMLITEQNWMWEESELTEEKLSRLDREEGGDSA